MQVLLFGLGAWLLTACARTPPPPAARVLFDQTSPYARVLTMSRSVLYLRRTPPRRAG